MGIAEAQPQRDRMQPGLPGLLVLPGVLAQELTEACALWSPIECCLFSTGALVLHSNFCFAWPGLETIEASSHQFQFRYLINVLVGEVINSPCTVYTFS